MPKGLNRAELIGHLGADPELKFTPSGIAVTTFSMATSESWTTEAGEKKEATVWHNIVVWKKLAEVCKEYLHKGSKVYVSGKIQNRSYDKDGIKKYISEIVVDQLIMLDNKPQSSGQATEPSAPPAEPDVNDKDLPF